MTQVSSCITGYLYTLIPPYDFYPFVLEIFQSNNKLPTRNNATCQNININKDVTDSMPNSFIGTMEKIINVEKEYVKESINNTRYNSDKKVRSLKRCLSMKKSMEIESPNDNSSRNFIPTITSSNTVSDQCKDIKTSTDNSLPFAKLLLGESNTLVQNNVIEPYAKEDLETEIKLIRNRIVNKEQQLLHLKQANIYQKLHKVKEIEQLTLLWKNGCIHVLSDLLLQLQNHGPMDMVTLLQNLNIPKNIISCTSDGDLS